MLVQSREGGLVKQDCSSPGCWQFSNLSANEFAGLDLWLDCPKCARRMQAARDPIGNYGYRCPQCEIFVKLASMQI